MVLTDRGKGFFHPSNGKVTSEHKAALDAAGLKAFQGDDASVQSGELGDCMLHEAAVAWLWVLEGRTTPAVPWKESREQFITRLKAQVQKVNDTKKVQQKSGVCGPRRKTPGSLPGLACYATPRRSAGLAPDAAQCVPSGTNTRTAAAYVSPRRHARGRHCFHRLPPREDMHNAPTMPLARAGTSTGHNNAPTMAPNNIPNTRGNCWEIVGDVIS